MDELNHPEPKSRQDSFLPRISVTRPVTVTMCLVALLVVGAVAYSRLSVQAFPSGWEWRWLWVAVNRRGTSPQEVDRNIRRPVEEHLRTVKGYRRIRSSSSAQWGLWMGLEFRQDVDLDQAYNQMTDRLERAKLDLPAEVRDEVRIWKWNQERDQPVMWGGVQLPEGVGDPREFADVNIRRPLERIEGVARVEVWGTDTREVVIELDNQKMQTRGINHFQLVQALRQDNFALSGGFVREGGKKYFVRSTANYRSLEEIGNIPLTFAASPGPVGQILGPNENSPSARAVERGGRSLRAPPDYIDVRVKDIAEVTYKLPERRWIQKINGKSAIAIGIFRESGENIVAVCRRTADALDRIGERTGTRFDVFFNQGSIVEQSIANLRNTGIWGGAFAAAVLLYFLQTVRMTALITLSIPLCVMISLLGIYVLEWSLNSMTMMGLMVGVGMVVDNAIVIVENIYRLRAKGEDPHRASIVGASEVGLAITMATLTSVVVFLPLMLMGGNARSAFYLSKMGLPVVFSLLGSLFVALLFIPLAAKRFGDARVGKEPKGIQRTRGVYLRTLQWCLHHRRDTIILVLAVAATTLYPMEKVKKGGGRSWDASQNVVRIRVKGPPFFGLEMMDSLTTEMVEILDPKREIYDIRTIRTWFDDDYGNVILFLNPPPNQEWWYQIYRDTRNRVGYPVDNRMDRKMVIEDIKKVLPEYVGIKLSVQKRISNEDAGLDLNFYGDDFETLAALLEESERRIRKIPSIVSTDTDLERGSSEVQVTIHREQARRLGFTPDAIGRSISYLVQGANLPRLQMGEKEIDVRLRLAEKDRKTLMQLKSYTFQTPEGEEVPLSSFSDFKVSKGSGTIRREDGRMRLKIRITTSKDDIEEVYSQINQVMDGFEMPRGYSWDKGESYSKLREKEDQMGFAILMAVTFVFLLMGVLFESVILPFSVILSIPLAFFGVYWTLFLTETRMDDMASMGCVVLIGVVVNNAIVLVDMVNRLRQDGMGRLEAILEAGHNRYRPILMTTFTTVFGLIPMAMSVANMMGSPIAPLGRTMMGGLISSTFLTLVVVPIFYTLFDDLRLALRRLAHGAFVPNSSEGALAGSADDD